MGEARWVSPLPNPAGLRDRVVRALGEVADVCLEEANRTVPFEDGDLARSGHTRVDRGALTSEVAYGTPYAVVQHEDASLEHKGQGRDHWLERTVYENAERYAAHLAKALEQ